MNHTNGVRMPDFPIRGGSYTLALGKKARTHTILLKYVPYRRIGDTSHYMTPLLALEALEGLDVDYYWGEDYWGLWKFESIHLSFDGWRLKPDGVGSSTNQGGLYPTEIGVDIKLKTDAPVNFVGAT